MAVRIRMKKMGRKHRPFFRICAIDKRSPRDGRVIEELGYYDPMCKEKDARAVLKGERVAYWLGVGAQPSDKCAVLIKKYGQDGTHLEQQKNALERLSLRPQAPQAVAIPLPSTETPEPAAEASSSEESSKEGSSNEGAATEEASETTASAAAAAPETDTGSETASEPTAEAATAEEKSE